MKPADQEQVALRSRQRGRRVFAVTLSGVAMGAAVAVAMYLSYGPKDMSVNESQYRVRKAMVTALQTGRVPSETIEGYRLYFSDDGQTVNGAPVDAQPGRAVYRMSAKSDLLTPFGPYWVHWGRYDPPRWHFEPGPP